MKKKETKNEKRKRPRMKKKETKNEKERDQE